MDFAHRARLCGAALLLLVAGGACGGGGSAGSGSGGAGGGGAASGGAPGSGGGGATTGSGGASGAGSGGASAGTGGTAGGGGGGSAPDGGTGGSASADDGGGGDGASAACPHVLCDDFESDTVGSPPNETRWHQDGTPTIVDAVNPHKGAHALHVLPHVGALCTDGMPCLAARFARLTDAFPAALHKQHYGRLYFYLAQMPTDLKYYHWMVMEVNASTSYSGGLALRQGGEMPQGGPLMNGVA
ncbi:MAG TPA: hypothetical protein VMU50_23885, partial [Polyangia bacterium]|nr:hypothetical protein [Polyangia bacterium]